MLVELAALLMTAIGVGGLVACHLSEHGASRQDAAALGVAAAGVVSGFLLALFLAVDLLVALPWMP